MSSGSIFFKRESNVQSYARSFPAEFATAKNADVWTTDGRRIIDFLSGAGSLNYGHNNPVLKDALLDYIQTDGVSQSLDLNTTAKAGFLRSLDEKILKPRGLNHVVQFTGPTGTNAVEAALKLARKVTGRSSVVFFTNGFHGVSLGALATTGNQHHRGAAGTPLNNATPTPFDGYFGDTIDTAEILERMLDDPSSGVDLPAAVILETVQGEGGLKAARPDWLRRISEICRARGILLIVDDIQAGCGRTGAFFSFEEAGLTPDIVTVSKSLSGYGLPMAIVLIEPSIDRWRPGEHNGTFRGNNLAFVTASKMIDAYWSDDRFASEVRRKGAHLRQRLKAMTSRFFPHLLEVRGRGMMSGVLCADPQRAAAATAIAFQSGLMIERSGPHDEVVKCLAPLTIEQSVLDEGLDILEHAFAQVFDGGRAAATPQSMNAWRAV